MSQIAIDNKWRGKYLDLEISCPACGKGGVSKWVHANNNCYRYTEINEYGYVRCKHAHGAPFYDWKWKCRSHQGVYKRADQEYLSSALMHLIEQMTTKDFKWYAKLVNHVNEQFEGH